MLTGQFLSSERLSSALFGAYVMLGAFESPQIPISKRAEGARRGVRKVQHLAEQVLDTLKVVVSGF